MARTGDSREHTDRLVCDQLVGRDEELKRLRTLLSSAASGQGASILVEGEAGSGKTALLEVLTDECRDAGFRVLRGMGEEIEQRVPFRALQSCLRSARPAASDNGSGHPDPGATSDIPALLRAEAGRTGADWEFCITDAIVSLVDGWTAAGCVALLLDDLHLADRASLAVLNRLQRTVGRLPLLVCATLQPPAQHSDLAGALRVFKQRGAHTVELAPLTEDGVRELVELQVKARPTPALMERLSAAGGNPLLATEVVAALREHGGLRVAEGVADIAPGAWAPTKELPRALKETIPRRLALLPDRTRDILDVAAVLGPRVHLSELSIVLGTPVMKLWELVGEALETGLVLSADDCIAFRHDLVRRALVESMPHAVRSALQQQAGQALAAAGAAPERAAEYLLLSDAPLDHRTLDWLVRTADSLALRAPAAAADLLDRALRTVRPPDPRAASLSLCLARVLLRLGQPARAEKAARSHLGKAPDAAVQTEFRWLVAQCAFRQGRVEGAVAEAEEALASAVGPADAARFHAFTARCRYQLRDLEGAERSALRAVAAGEAGSDTYVTAYALNWLAMARIPALRTTEALALAERAIALLGNQEARPDLPMAPHFLRAVTLADLDLTEEAHHAFDRGLHEYEQGHGNFLTWYHIGKAQLHYGEGRWDDALADIGAGLDSVDSLGLVEALRSQAALIAVHRADATTYADLVEQPDDSIGGTVFGFLRCWARALTREARGDAPSALALLLDLWQRESGSMGHRRQLCPDIARLASQLGDTSTLRALTTALEKPPTEGGGPRLAATALLCRGTAEQSGEVLLQAAEAFRDARWPLAEGYAAEAAASAFALRERPDTARKTFQAALAVYERLGAAWDARRAEHSAAAAGVRVRRRPRGGPRTGWAALTETERAIVDHVAKGRSNPDIGARMFLSPRTVQFHLSRIYAKLEVTSRVELAVEAHQHGVREPASRVPAAR